MNHSANVKEKMPPDLEQKDRQEFILKKLGNQEWLEVCRLEDGPNSTMTWSALIPTDKAHTQMKRAEWEFCTGKPGHIVYGTQKQRTQYFRYGNDDGLEPLVFKRDFSQNKSSFLEISEEFRLLHNLHPATQGKLVKLHDNGLEEDAVFITENVVRIRLRLIRQFLAVKDMQLLIFFVMEARSDIELQDDHLKNLSKQIRTDIICYNLWAWNNDSVWNDEPGSASRMAGKKLISSFPKSQCGIWPFDERNQQYADFVIGFDENGKDRMSSCKPDKLADFEKSDQSTEFLTPIFFRREVLQKYYAKPQIYSVEAGYVRSEHGWGLKTDDEHKKYIVVFLGDLGGLPYEEQIYWKSFNVPPDGGISKGCYERNFLCVWTPTTHPEFRFKHAFPAFQRSWEEKFGWPLFLPLNDDDKHIFKTLHIPLTEEQSEFDGQTLSLAKLLVDSLNEEQIGKLLSCKIESEKGIAKFERFLKENGVACESIGLFLRRLYGLRNGAGHRKGASYEKSAKFFGLDVKPRQEVFAEILVMASEVLEILDRNLVQPKSK